MSQGNAGARAAVRDALTAHLRENDELLVIHSSLFALRLDPSTQRWDLLSALRHIVDSGRTVAVPAFTFSFTKGAPFALDSSPSETGQLADWLLELPEAQRTTHPIYSFAVAGPLADQLVATRSTTTFGDDSPFAIFEARNAPIMMLGCGWGYCTLFHRFEELAAVPYRFYKDFTGVVDLGAGPVESSARMYVRDLGIDACNDWSPAIRELRDRGAISHRELGAGDVEVARAAEIAAVARRMLADDPYAFVRSPNRVAELVSRRSDPPVRIAVLGSQNLDLFRRALTDVAQADASTAEVSLSAVGQWATQVLDPRSDLRTAEHDISFVIDRIEDVLGVDSLDNAPESVDLDARLDQWLAVVEEWSSRQSAPVVIAGFVRTTATSIPPSRAVAIVERANTALRERFLRRPGVHLFDTAGEAAAHEGSAHDARLWQVARAPFSAGFTRSLARSWWGLARSATGRTARAIVVDLDGTLWGGVVGEDGVAGIQIGGDHPGNAFARLQRALRSLRERGVLLAIASKNDERLALQALREHAAMILRPDDFVTTRIDWQPKPQHLVSIARELGFAPGQILFVDDNPVERERMREELPAVQVLELPEDPSGYADALLRHPSLQAIDVTAADLARADSYADRGRVESERQRYERVEDFLASLEVHIRLDPLDDGNLARAAQLMQKTNQLNTTTRRYTATQLRALQDDGADVRVVAAGDKFSPTENVGVLIVQWPESDSEVAHLDTILLSCRVLGRGIESALLDWVDAEAASKGASRLVADFFPTERNAPAQAMLSDNGFELQDDGTWLRAIGTAPRAPWIRAEQLPSLSGARQSAWPAYRASAVRCFRERRRRQRARRGPAAGAPRAALHRSRAERLTRGCRGWRYCGLGLAGSGRDPPGRGVRVRDPALGDRARRDGHVRRASTAPGREAWSR